MKKVSDGANYGLVDSSIGGQLARKELPEADGRTRRGLVAINDLRDRIGDTLKNPQAMLNSLKYIGVSRRVIGVMLVMASFGATAKIPDNLAELEASSFKACIKASGIPNQNYSQIEQGLKACEVAQVYNRAYGASRGDAQAFNDLSWLCRGATLQGLEERALACGLAIAIIGGE